MTDKVPAMPVLRKIKRNDVARLCDLVMDGIARYCRGITVVRNTPGDDADHPFLSGIILFKTEFDPVQAVRLQHDRAPIPFADKIVMDRGRQHKIAVCYK